MSMFSRIGLLAAAVAAAAQCGADEPRPILTRDELAALYSLPVDDVRDGPIAGVYELANGRNVAYITKDGQYVIRGDIVDLKTEANLTEARRAEKRAALLAAIDPAAEIVFSPPNGPAEYRIFVFTDVDCGYCRQFHRGIAEVNALGIEVRYVSYPRTGPNTESWTKAEGVWCAADRKAALTQAKFGAAVEAVPDCHSAPIAAEYELGRRIGLSGTPAIYSESGVDLGGYLPPAELLERLRKIAAK